MNTKYRNLILNSLCILGLCLWIYSCKKSESDLNIINGIVDKNNEFPAVLPISSEKLVNAKSKERHLCTSSVISHNTLLTAAHCLVNEKIGSIGVVKDDGKKVLAKAFYIMDDYKEKYLKETVDEATSEDIGILVFEDNTFKGITPLKISNKQIKRGDNIVQVGYASLVYWDPQSKKLMEVVDKQSRRRWGTNWVQPECALEGVNCFTTVSDMSNLLLDPKKKSDQLGTAAVPFQGDSGGPALDYNNEKLILGVASACIPNEDKLLGINVKFDNNIVQWLRKIDKTTKANISFDEIK